MSSHRRQPQHAIACTLMRGGSSKGLFFQGKDLPPPGLARDRLLMRAMGTPDPLQIDGLGGSRLITSKIAIVDPPTVPGADLDYTFAQVDIARAVIDYEGNCGNVSAAVGPWAIDAGWVPATEPTTCVRIHNTNTGKILLSTVPVVDGAAQVEGDFAIAGVPGTGAEILMDYRMTAGTKTSGLLPTGNASDSLQLASGECVRLTVCDLANVAVLICAQSLGITGNETPAAMEADARLMSRLAEIRGRVAQQLSFCDDWEQADTQSPLLPTLIIVAPGSPSQSDLLARFYFLGRVHEAMSATGAACMAAASRVPGTVVAGCLDEAGASASVLRIAHPCGVMQVNVRADGLDAHGLPQWESLSFGRTARKLMDGFVHVPRATDMFDVHADTPSTPSAPSSARQVRYIVEHRVDESVCAHFEAYMRAHLGEVGDTGFFLNASLEHLGPGHYRLVWLLPDIAALEAYQRDCAPALRADFAAQFPQGVNTTRTHSVVLATWSSTPGRGPVTRP